MSKWIFSPQKNIFWNLDKADKVILKENRIEVIYDDDGGCNFVEFDTHKEMMDTWNDLKRRLLE